MQGGKATLRETGTRSVPPGKVSKQRGAAIHRMAAPNAFAGPQAAYPRKPGLKLQESAPHMAPIKNENTKRPIQSQRERIGRFLRGSI